MRLYLSSFRLGKHYERLVDMTGGGGRVLIIMNSCDFYSSERRAKRFQQECAEMQRLGFQVEELDLRKYFKQPSPNQLETILRTADLLWVRGGNSFVLLRALKQSGLHQVLPQLLEDDTLVYGGYSAGVDMLMSDIHGLELMDNPHDIPSLYDSEVVWEGLGLIPFAVVPHYHSDHPESPDAERLVQHYIDHHVPFIALCDGQVIVQDTGIPLTVLA